MKWLDKLRSYSRIHAEKAVELACPLEAHKIVTAANVPVADPDLRNRIAPARPAAHIRAQFRLSRDVHLFKGHAL